ncbi:hypothetical protein ZHAS_00005939 [Anopheles sinensis]|uniref:Uncharacterized protein n=1 Tax=Anopheles sinensis TaxID=74873 RepID=A0A084VKN6_ANOSI|nr:hypothetical protein ZHAS_00005939 [Anopheles sinensis]
MVTGNRQRCRTYGNVHSHTSPFPQERTINQICPQQRNIHQSPKKRTHGPFPSSRSFFETVVLGKGNKNDGKTIDNNQREQSESFALSASVKMRRHSGRTTWVIAERWRIDGSSSLSGCRGADKDVMPQPVLPKNGK